MLTLSVQSRILIATSHVDFRKGIDSLAALCRHQLEQDPMKGAVFVFRNRRATAVRLLAYDGQGYWLLTKRLSQGRFLWWPKVGGVVTPLALKELHILLWNGHPQRAQLADDWRPIV